MPQFHALKRRFNGAPLLIEAPKFYRDAEVRAWHVELLNQVSRLDGYHLPEADPVLFETFAPWYQAIAQRLKPRFEPAILDSVSRHCFFISMGVEQADGKEVVGLSGLEILMGFTHHRGAVGADQPVLTLTSGNADMDLLASLELIFQDRAPWMVANYPRVDLLDLLSQGQNLRRGQEALDELQSERDRALFEKNQAAIAEGFRQHGGFDF